MKLWIWCPGNTAPVKKPWIWYPGNEALVKKSWIWNPGFLKLPARRSHGTNVETTALGSEVPSISGNDGSLSGPKILFKNDQNRNIKWLEHLIGLD